jgi:hypothetical protein
MPTAKHTQGDSDPLSRLSLLLAIQRAKASNFHHFAAALVAIYKREYPNK